MTDDREDFLGPEGEQLPDIGEIIVDGSIDLDVEETGIIVFDGSFVSDLIDFSGGLEIVFASDVPAYDTIFTTGGNAFIG